MTAREPCGHVWGPWETVYEGTLGGTDKRATGDLVRLCVLCGSWGAQWAGEADLITSLSATATWLNELAENGPDLRINAHKKTATEAKEFASDPSLEEWADVAICLVGAALHNRWTVAQLSNAVAAKNAINAARTWRQEPDGTWQHVPGAAA